jgi:hypothetical protein
VAIAFADAGAGDEILSPTGADCNPACPATVNAGDILIGHVSIKGTSLSPTTPSGWTLLDGPRDVGTTVAARHWVYGKVAAGDEDGTTVSFSTDNSAHTYARIYRYTGRVSGTITELVKGFSSIAHATDPQGPSVTTTETGALAVAAMTQSDNNAVAAIAGMSGGTWAESVAEYLPALGTGASLILNHCTPTANPGTVSGGAVVATNDPSGTIGFEIRTQPADATVTPGVIACTTTLPQPAVGVGAAPAALAAVAALPLVVSAGQGGTGVTVTPGVIAALAALPQPAVGVGAAPTQIAASSALPQPSIGVGVAPAALAAVAALPQAGVGVGAAPGVLAAPAALPQAAVGVGAAPAAVPAVVALPQAAVRVGAAPGAVPLVVALPQATAGEVGGGGATVTPAVIATLAALPQATVGVGAAPAVVPLLAALPQAVVAVHALALPAVIAAVAAVPPAAVGVGAAPAVIALLVALPLPEQVGESGGVNLNPAGPTMVGGVVVGADAVAGATSLAGVVIGAVVADADAVAGATTLAGVMGGGIG